MTKSHDQGRGLRVLLIASTFHPTIGGAETYALELTSELGRRGHEVAVVTDYPCNARPSEFNAPGLDATRVAVHRLSAYRALLNDESKVAWEQLAFGLLDEMSGTVMAFRPNLVLSNSLDAAWTARVVAADLNLPWAAAFHEQAPESEAFGEGRLRVVYEFLRPDLVLAGSEFYSDRARRWGASAKLRRIYHGVDLDTFHPSLNGEATRKRYGLRPDEKLVVFAGRLKHRKGVHVLLDAFGGVVKLVRNAKLLVAGTVSSASREYADSLRESARLMGIEHAVIFDETVTFDQMPSLLAAADIVAQPSLEEGLGLAILEAMAAGKPVVTTDIPGVREIVTDQQVAMVVRPNDSGELRAGLLRLLGDVPLQLALGARGRQHVELHFSRTRMMNETIAALSNLATDHKK